MHLRRLSLQDYTVGWVCALPDELAAAAELLDEEHQGHPNDPNVTNLYTLGCMSGHNIVITCLPAGQLGTNSAATVASHMKSTFTSVRFGLMVGIGGGVPSGELDIRLGDVVVSQPRLEHGGVIYYDFGKTGPSGFTRTGALNAPPALLLSAISNLQANHYRDRNSLLPHIATIGRLPRFTRVSAGPDILFEATYNHVGGMTCDQCDKKQTVRREERKSAEIVVHYGTIASGNQVMKDGNTRDRLSSELGGVLCFEMEAAGLMNSFPCLVIRGICDYADSHKNKKWQPAGQFGSSPCGSSTEGKCRPRLEEVHRRPPQADWTSLQYERPRTAGGGTEYSRWSEWKP
ncbi:purine and uridine phosphorylase [Zopfia rhizophila CBS 207.26]|uniref:Purine and uridine phosphorylase n=1 Tax=Zopfia rhizophila CBS 207.26 TaxID=1314779 RepID=A0A6A6ELW4_9PEZI|nr:purine and uridine phosphorylase [Zopfia rhizophila CBS 207.26]